MIHALVALVAAAQISTTVRPPGASSEFHGMADAVEQAAAAGDYAKAGRLLTLLPKTNIVYQWDDSKVPAQYRDAFARSRDTAFRDWNNTISELKFVSGPNPDLRISFEPTLSTNSESGLPLTLAKFWSEVTGKPRLEAVVGLNRGKPAQATTPTEVENEIRYIVGAYLGLGNSPLFGPAMSRIDQPTKIATQVVITEANTAASALNYAETLRDLVAKKKPINAFRPKAFTDTTSLDLGTVTQGQIIQASVQLTNTGTGALAFSILPDCGCLRVTPTGVIPAGTTKLLKADFDSTEFVGEVSKKLAVYTNDPDKPAFVIPVKAKIIPSYRFIRPEGNVLVADGRTASATVYLTLPEGSDIIPLTPELEPQRGTVKMEDWQGSLADPALNEPAMPRKGYKFTIDLENLIATGRSGVSLVVPTNSQAFPQLRYSLYVQRGIIALPVRMFFGQMDKAPKQATLVLSRPGRPFKILGIENPSPNLDVKVEPVKDKANSEYRITATYDGKANPGPFRSVLKVKTDDPTQPLIELPVSGTVR